MPISAILVFCRILKVWIFEMENVDMYQFGNFQMYKIAKFAILALVKYLNFEFLGIFEISKCETFSKNHNSKPPKLLSKMAVFGLLKSAKLISRKIRMAGKLLIRLPRSAV